MFEGSVPTAYQICSYCQVRLSHVDPWDHQDALSKSQFVIYGLYFGAKDSEGK